MRRREFIALSARVSHGRSLRWRRNGADVSPWRRVRRSTSAPLLALMFDELRRVGFIEGQNLTIEWREYGPRVDLIPEFVAGSSKPMSMSFMSPGTLQFARHSRRRQRFRSSGLPRIWSGRDW